MKSDVELIKEKLSILDIVSEYVKLTPSGSYYKGLSPFTKEKSPSFFVTPEKGLYHCFSTGKGGDMITFIQEVEGFDFRGSLEFLASKAGVILTGVKGTDQKQVLYTIMSDAASFFVENLSKNTKAQVYLSKRGVNAASRDNFQVGYAPENWHGLSDYLLNKGYAIKDCLAVGLLKHSQKSNKPYDFFRNRIMFPIKDISGRVVGFTGRTLERDTSSMKYLNTPETVLFKKSDVAYGFFEARKSIHTLNAAILVEGQFDVVLAHQIGYTNTIAVSGTALSESHMQKIRIVTDNVLIVFDNDRAGMNSLVKATTMFFQKGMYVKSVILPEGADPADVIVSNKSLWIDAIKNAVDPTIPLVGYCKRIAKSDQDLIKLVTSKIIPVVSACTLPLEEERLMFGICTELGISREVLQKELLRVKTQVIKKNESIAQIKSVETLEHQLSQIGNYLKKTQSPLLGEYISICTTYQKCIQSDRINDRQEFSELEFISDDRQDQFIAESLITLEIMLIKKESLRLQKQLPDNSRNQNETLIKIHELSVRKQLLLDKLQTSR